MKHLSLNDYNLKLFLKNLRDEDKKELEVFLCGENLENEFINLVKSQSDVDFISSDGNTPLALGGVCEINKDTGQIWLLSSKYVKKHKIPFLRYLDSKIRAYKKKYKFLFNYIYKANFPILFYLKKHGFKSQNTINSDFKLFYFTHNGGENFDIRYFTCQQLPRE